MLPEEDIPLSEEEINKIKDILGKKNFEDFKIHSHYWFKGIEGMPRHGFDIDNLRLIFNKTDLITHGFKRKSSKGFGYTLIYKKSKHSFIKICYFFDEIPVKIFNAIPINRNLDKAVSKKYGLRI